MELESNPSYNFLNASLSDILKVALVLDKHDKYWNRKKTFMDFRNAEFYRESESLYKENMKKNVNEIEHEFRKKANSKIGKLQDKFENSIYARNMGEDAFKNEIRRNVDKYIDNAKDKISKLISNDFKRVLRNVKQLEGNELYPDYLNGIGILEKNLIDKAKMQIFVCLGLMKPIEFKHASFKHRGPYNPYSPCDFTGMRHTLL